MTTHTNIAQLLLRIRSSKNLSQAEFSSSIYTQSLLSRIEANDTHPTFSRVIALLEHNNITLAEFEYLLHPPSFFQKLTYRAIFSLDIVFIKMYHSQIKQLHIMYYDALLSWFQYCFNLEITSFTVKVPDNISDILDQDEFYNLDIILLIYYLPNLPLDTALYTYNRLLQHLQTQEISLTQPYLIITAALSIASCYLLNNNQEQALYYYLHALEEARTLMSVHHLILINLIIYRELQVVSYKDEAKSLSILFLKDNLYEYWYNVIIVKK